jgi:hypothetical protein
MIYFKNGELFLDAVQIVDKDAKIYNADFQIVTGKKIKDKNGVTIIDENGNITGSTGIYYVDPWKSASGMSTLRLQDGLVPIGTIIDYIPGYFTDGVNGSPTITSIATLLGYYTNWKACDGSLFQDAQSPIFNGTGRYLPKLDDSRFVMGFTSAGTIGGNNFMNDHAHVGTSGNASATHAHSYSGTSSGHNVGHTHTGTTVAEPNHTHGFKIASLSGASAASTPRIDVYYQVGAYYQTQYTDGAGNHSHTFTSDGVSNDHTHTYSGNVSAGGDVHTHTTTVGSGTNPIGSNTVDNRPKFLSAYKLMRVK